MNTHRIASIVSTAIVAAGIGAAAAIGAAGPAAAACPGNELDHCFGESQMNQFLNVGNQMVSDYLTHIGVSSRPPVRYISDGESVNSACKDKNGRNVIQQDDAYDYCPADNIVYIGQRGLWGYYQEHGAAGPIAGLAHEYGHYLQAIRGVTTEDTIAREDQADCVAGDFVGYLKTLGDVEYPQDYRNLGDMFRSIGSKEGPGRNHGTPAERVNVFEKGLFGGLRACNGFTPGTPLAT